MSSIELPIKIPITFREKNETVKLPFMIPFSFGSGKNIIKLPTTLPLKFESVGQVKKYVLIPYKELVNLDALYKKTVLPVSEQAIGNVIKIPYVETAWDFPGLILQERILSYVNKEITLAENVQSLILVDFELVSTNTLKIKWYGNSVPSFTIMKKSAIDENYTSAGNYNWSDESATFEIGSEDYNVYLQGTANSGTSAVYTIAGINDALVIPELEVLLNEKLFEYEINNTSEYILEINY